MGAGFKRKYFPAGASLFYVLVLPVLLMWIFIPASSVAAGTDTGEGTEEISHYVYDEDKRLKRIQHETYEYDKADAVMGNGLYSRDRWVTERFDEAEIAETSHACFDERNRLTYVLGYSPAILGDGRSYCEERIYSRDDAAHTCRYIYYKSNSSPYKDGYYIAFRYMFETCDYRFDEEERLLSFLSYRRNVGSDPNGYSEELFFDEGYQAGYDGKYLTEELWYRDFWGTNEVGVWQYRIYRYNEQGDCILQASVTEDDIMVVCYEYDKDAGQADVYTYQVTEDFELSCDDGSICFLRPGWGKPAVRKVAADGSVERTLFYGQAMDMGQRHYLMPEEVEETADDHKYTVRPGDCLWDIAKRCYGHGAYCELIYHENRSVVGPDENLLVPGMRLYLPEVGNAQDTNVQENR